MLKVYDYDASPNCLKLKILLKELEVPYEEEWLSQSQLRAPAYCALFPMAQAPAIRDGSLYLAESAAIALYLAEKHGRLIPPQPERRALMYQALFVEASLLAPTVGGQGLFGELYKPDSERNTARIAELQQKALHVGKAVSALLGDKPFFAEEFSLADIQFYPAISKSLPRGLLGAAENFERVVRAHDCAGHGASRTRTIRALPGRGSGRLAPPALRREPGMDAAVTPPRSTFQYLLAPPLVKPCTRRR